jgi:hypothetical protein
VSDPPGSHQVADSTRFRLAGFPRSVMYAGNWSARRLRADSTADTASGEDLSSSGGRWACPHRIAARRIASALCGVEICTRRA